MIGITEAAELAEDFRATANYPAGDDHRLSILIETLARASKSIPHARVIVETWLAEQRFFPTPADLRTLGAKLMDPGKVMRFDPPECKKCGDCGAIFLDGKREDLSVERVRSRLKAGTLRLCGCGMAGFWNEWVSDDPRRP